MLCNKICFLVGNNCNLFQDPVESVANEHILDLFLVSKDTKIGI
jgi:hypothetical protein